MRDFLFHNDRSTRKDELFLFLFILLCVIVGILLYVFAPVNWIIPQSIIKVFGVIWMLTGVMFIPGLINRLIHNR